MSSVPHIKALQVTPAGAKLGEGPCWIPVSYHGKNLVESLVWLDILSKTLHIHNPAENVVLYSSIP